MEAFCYINSNCDAKQSFASYKMGDGRIEENAKIKDLWLNEINHDNYLKGSPDLFRSLGWKEVASWRSQ